MRVLLLTYHFPPDPAVGSLRAAKVARAFLATGHRVDVVTARLPGETGTRTTTAAGLVVHPVPLLHSPRDLAASIMSLFSKRRRHGADGTTSVEWTPQAHVASWKRLLSALIWLPDDRQGFILPAWREARRLARAGARLVYSTAPP